MFPELFRVRGSGSVMPRETSCVGLDNTSPPVILRLLDVGATNRQTDREVGAQSEGPRSGEVAWLPKPMTMKTDVCARFRPASTLHRRDRGVRWCVGSGLILLLLAGASSARAETPVGLDALGVDPLAAVDNPQGLDVRDELGRQVTAKVVLRDMRRATVERAVEVSYASSLPKAKIILPALELAVGLGLRLVQFAADAPGAIASASLPGASPKWMFVLILFAMVAATARRAVRPCPCPISMRRGRCRPEVLLC